MSSRDVSSCDVTRAVGMWEAICHWILWRKFILLSLCLRHVIPRASTALTFLLSHTFREVSSRDVRIVCPRPKTRSNMLSPPPTAVSFMAYLSFTKASLHMPDLSVTQICCCMVLWSLPLSLLRPVTFAVGTIFRLHNWTDSNDFYSFYL